MTARFCYGTCVIDLWLMQIEYTMSDNVFMFILHVTKQLSGIQKFNSYESVYTLLMAD